ncbi:hypothetical protein WN55_07886 [Dufourea novaeangliae]|uniref:MADF domain-containing protein n=1 Tax=Dufourea novaeangliae TaxID=178035 RepID=A0A154PSQ0_DUFNO|nr:hypothetical protein WN55_07886 [Dufourea novaeangliae]
MDIEILISEVAKHPILWDVSNYEYKDKIRRNEVWSNVAATVSQNFKQNTETEKKIIVQEVISKWRSVRDNYIRSLRKQDENIKLGSATKKIWRYVYEDQLAFLKKCREPRPTSSSTEMEGARVKTDSEQSTDNELEITEANVADNESTDNFKHQPRKKLKRINLNEKFVDVLESKRWNDDDEDMAFYRSTLPMIKTFTTDEKVQFRIKVMELIQDIRKPSI